MLTCSVFFSPIPPRPRTKTTYPDPKQESGPEAQIRALMNRVFTSGSAPLTSEEQKRVKDLVKDAQMRKLFSGILLQPKQQGAASLCLGPGSFSALSYILCGMLDCSNVSKQQPL